MAVYHIFWSGDEKAMPNIESLSRDDPLRTAIKGYKGEDLMIPLRNKYSEKDLTNGEKFLRRLKELTKDTFIDGKQVIFALAHIHNPPIHQYSHHQVGPQSV
jgi:hypothetical protein